MAFTESIFRRFWWMIPASTRNTTLVQWVKDVLKPFLDRHDSIYSDEFFTYTVDPIACQAAPIIAQSIINEFQPTRVIDVGCGTGALLKCFKDRGCTCRGLEYAQAGLKVCRSRDLDVLEFDIGRDKLNSTESYDVALSIEVAEHLPETAADRYIDLLAGLAPVIVFTAATPGQGGVDHINEQPNDYWISRFGVRGFALDSVLSSKWRRDWSTQIIDDCYYRNVMVFRRTP